jgi:hypothetical protein
LTATEDRKLRQALHGTLQGVPPSPAPLEAILRRGKAIRLRRAGAAAGSLALAGIVAVAALVVHGGRAPGVPATVPAEPVAAAGVFAHGAADGHAWQLTAQNIADPGYACQPAMVLNGTDADPVYPGAGNLAAVTLGPSLPGIGFGFIQVPAAVSGITVNGRAHVPAVTVSACGLRYHVAGFAYSLAATARVTLANAPSGGPTAVTMPHVSTQASSAGRWINTYPAGEEGASGALDSELVYGPNWSMAIQFGTGGDCYGFTAQSSAGSAQMAACGPVSTPTGPETIMALPLSYPSHPKDVAVTGYALQVSPVTAALEASLSNGSSEMASFCISDGRKYAVFVVSDPLRLSRLTWLDAQSQVIASTTALPRYGYVQFQP